MAWAVEIDEPRPASERARAGVTRAIRQAITRIADHHPQLGEHLSRTIRTGTYCAYMPDPRTPPGGTPDADPRWPRIGLTASLGIHETNLSS